MEQDELEVNLQSNKTPEIKKKKYWWYILLVVILLIVGGCLVLVKYKVLNIGILNIKKIGEIIKPDKQADTILKIDSSEVAKVDTSKWRDFVYEYFGYKLKVPNNVMVGGSTDYNATSSLRQGDKKYSLAVSRSDEYYIYFFPEGGFSYANKQLYKTPIKSYSSKINSKPVTVNQYDDENIHIIFDNYHGFVIRVFVDKDKQEYWPVVEKILQLADLTDNIPAITTSTKK